MLLFQNITKIRYVAVLQITEQILAILVAKVANKNVGCVGRVIQSCIKFCCLSVELSLRWRNILETGKSNLKCQILPCSMAIYHCYRELNFQNLRFYKRNAKSIEFFYTAITELNSLNIANIFKRTWQRWSRYLVSLPDLTYIRASHNTALFHISHKTFIFAQKKCVIKEKYA